MPYDIAWLVFSLYLAGLAIELGRVHQFRLADAHGTQKDDLSTSSVEASAATSVRRKKSWPNGHQWLLVLITTAILFHTVLIVEKLVASVDQSSVFSIRSHWFLIVSWAFALTYYIYLIRWSGKWFGLFLMVTVVLLGVGIFLTPAQVASRQSASRLLGVCHGLSLAGATLAIFSGSLAGLMDRAARRRLRKHKSSGPSSYPSLEWLSRYGRRCLGFATLMTTFGLLSGIGLIRYGHRVVTDTLTSSGTALVWYDPLVLGCAVLTCWLLHCEIRLWRHPEYGESTRLFRVIHLSSLLFLAMLLLLLHNATRHDGFGFTPHSVGYTDLHSDLSAQGFVETEVRS